ncbi:MAG: DUF4397 domain-containing protein [Terriglobales bacterium]
MFRLCKILPLVLAIIALCAFEAGCGSSSSSAEYRVVQTIPNAPAGLDISVNGKNAFTNVGFGVVAPAAGYTSVSTGSDPIEVFQTGTTTAVISSTPVEFVGGSQSTIVLTGLFSAPSMVVFPDNNTAPLSGQVEVRVIDAAPSAPASVDIYLVAPGIDITQADPIVSALEFGQGSIYIPLNTANSGYAQVMMIVTKSGSKTQLINQLYTPYQGAIRTLVLVDVSPGANALSFSPLELDDLDSQTPPNPNP